MRLTNASDCAGGADCLWYVGYSYWRNMNNHVGSADMYISLGTDPIVCFVRDANHNTDGSLDVLVVAPVMTDLDAAGGRDANGDDYEQLPKGNLDVTGKYFLWTTNLDGSRLDHSW